MGWTWWYGAQVFIDKYYQAKALSNVVLAVQSQHFNWTSKLACNDKPIRWDLRYTPQSTYHFMLTMFCSYHGPPLFRST